MFWIVQNQPIALGIRLRNVERLVNREMMSGPPTRILLVGAYERENFGDLLFLLQTRRFLAHARMTAAAPFSAEASDYLRESIVSYADALSEASPDAVWSVGGEVGGTSVPDAFRMSATEELRADVQALPEHDRPARIEYLTGLSRNSSPYLPRMSSTAATRGSNFVANSVGLIGFNSLRGNHRAETLGALRDANFISVRDKASSELLDRLSIRHRMAPDLVQSIVLNGRDTGEPEPDVALVQLKGKILESIGAEQLARVLATSSALKPFRIRLFSAGSARGHDSATLYEEVIQIFRRLAPGRTIELSSSRDPWDKADEIARCGLWIGTSLHGLIVSSAFDVPRVALELHKLSRYAETWEETMPYGVRIDDLDGAIVEALGNDLASRSSGRSQFLAKEAEASAIDAARQIETSRKDAVSRTADRERHDASIRKRNQSLTGQLSELSSKLSKRIGR